MGWGWGALSVGQWETSSQFGSWAIGVRKESVSSAGPCLYDRPALRSSDFREFINGCRRPGNCSHPPDTSERGGLCAVPVCSGSSLVPLLLFLISIIGSFRNGFGRQLALNVATYSIMPGLF